MTVAHELDKLLVQLSILVEISTFLPLYQYVDSAKRSLGSS